MFLVETYSLAVILCIVTMICWGSWPNMQKLTDRAWRFELFYWDYVWGIVIVSLLFAVTLGNSGTEGRSFWADMQQADIRSCVSTMIGGVIFNAGNILFVAAIAIAGMSVAFPIAAGLGLVIGVVTNYIAVPVGDPSYLFIGVVLIIGAMIFSGAAYKRLSQKQNKVSRKGILLSIAAGILFGFFYRFIAGSMAPDFDHPTAGKLTPYTAVVIFAIGALLSNVLLNTLLMKKPISGNPVGYTDYFRGSTKNHLMGIAGGLIWGTGLILSILSAGQAGYAISFGLGQGNAMIAAFWGVFIWKEFKNIAGTSGLLTWMFVCYIVGLILIILSR